MIYDFPTPHIEIVTIISKKTYAASLIKVLPPEKEEEFFDHFETSESSSEIGSISLCTQKEKEMITDLITALGKYNKIELFLYHKKRLEKLGNNIKYIHPLKFLAVIFSNPTLKGYMFNILNDYFKRKKFVEGLSKRMTNELIAGNITRYLPIFSREVGIPQEKIIPFIEKRDWINFLKFLTSH